MKLELRKKTLLAALLLVMIGAVMLAMGGASARNLPPDAFWLLRFPRVLVGIAVGGALAVSGTIIQSIMANPLADPYTIGVASAAALGAVVGSALRGPSLITTSTMAFLFSFGYLAALSWWIRKRCQSAVEVLLLGVVLGLFCSALGTLLLALSEPSSWTSSFLWMMGGLDRLTLSQALATLVLMITLCVLGWAHWKALDLIALGDLSARSVGLDPVYFRRRLLFLSALITAVSVSTVGVLGFLGLVVPHGLRLLGVRSHRELIPFCFLAGAGFLLCADHLARTMAAPSEVPVGVVLGVIGAPIFLYLLFQRQHARD